MKNNDYSLISKYRSVLMGIAILMIMFCHFDVAQSHHEMSVNSLARILHTFTVGVDIFLFLSGVGLFYSYTKKKTTYITFQKKRIIRLFPLYFLIAGITYIVYDTIIINFGLGKFLRDIFFISWFTESSTKYWYILVIAVFYLMFPVLYNFIHDGRNGLLKTVFLSLFWWLGVEAICYFMPTVSHFRIALERMPVFAFGIYCGKLSYDKAELKRIPIYLITIWGYIFFLLLKTPIIKRFAEQLYYPMRAFLSLSIIVTVILILEWLKGELKRVYNALIVVFSWFGSVTLELYLLHQSYMILFDYPYKALYYCLVAFGLPTITAASITLYRKKKVKI